MLWAKSESFWDKQKVPMFCRYCGNGPLERLHKREVFRATIDHLIPKSKRGSSNLKINGVVACYPCNKDKGVLMPDEWLAVLEYRKSRYNEPKI